MRYKNRLSIINAVSAFVFRVTTYIDTLLKRKSSSAQKRKIDNLRQFENV